MPNFMLRRIWNHVLSDNKCTSQGVLSSPTQAQPHDLASPLPAVACHCPGRMKMHKSKFKVMFTREHTSLEIDLGSI